MKSEYCRVRDLPDEYILVSNSQEVCEILRKIDKPTAYCILFVKLTADGTEYAEVYGCYGCVPYDSSSIYLLFKGGRK